MKRFSYRAMKKDGSRLEGEYEANTRNEVVNMITSNGFYPLKIEELSAKSPLSFSFNQRVGTKDLAIFCRQLYTMLDAGVSITNALNMLATQVTNPRLKTITGEIEEAVKKGDMLSEAMGRYKEFPKLLVSMIESGEATGNIDEMMLRMSLQFEKENKTNNKVRSAMIYPVILIVVSIVAVAFILTFVMPTFMEMFTQEEIELPMITKALIGLSGFLRSYFIPIIIVIVAIFIAIRAFKITPKGKEFFGKLAVTFPVIAELNKKIIVARFTRTMSTLLSAGISLIQALPTAGAVLNNVIAEKELEKVREKVVRGEGLSGPISECTIFPEMLSSMIKIGEESGSLDDILNKTADFYDEEVDQAITATTELIQPVLIVIMGLVVGGIVMAIMLPMFDMYSAM